ncbi:MAG: hypothetical protein M1829_004225 [Trizodia sp. TS-e1964]|nr:MAG: hypothetical protein M1829_004225 [Trizodia sp. TS-e1964]
MAATSAWRHCDSSEVCQESREFYDNSLSCAVDFGNFNQFLCSAYAELRKGVLIDGVAIYIDGGNTYVPQNNGTFFNTQAARFDKGMNSFFIKIDLSANFTNQETTPYTSIPKPVGVPNGLIEGALWYSRAARKIYQLGGWFSFNNQESPIYLDQSLIPPSAIWEYNVDNQAWSQTSFTLSNTGVKIDRPGAASYCDAPSINQSFIFQGYVQKRSDPDYSNYTTSSQFKFLEGMLALDTSKASPSSPDSAATLTNITVPNYFGPRMNGALVHIPVGDLGILVQIGGQTTDDMNTPFGVGIQGANGANHNVNMSIVDIYDIKTGNWFRQQTFGVPDIPTGRSDICTVMVSAADGSSHNIFVIAGVQTYNSVISYEDMWVLTLPTFQWKLVHQRNNGRYGHTCHVVGENLLIVGGMQTSSNGGDVTTCENHMPAEIFSLVEMNYTGKFDADGARRQAPVPQEIVDLIGGNRYGGAYVTQPQVWSDIYLQYVFNPKLNRPAYTPTYTLAVSATTPTSTASSIPDSSGGPNKGAIAGGAVGGAVLVGLIVAVFLVCCKSRAKKRQKISRPMSVTHELPPYSDPKPPIGDVEISGSDYTFLPTQRNPAELPTLAHERAYSPDITLRPDGSEFGENVSSINGNSGGPAISPRVSQLSNIDGRMAQVGATTSGAHRRLNSAGSDPESEVSEFVGDTTPQNSPNPRSGAVSKPLLPATAEEETSQVAPIIHRNMRESEMSQVSGM